MPVVTINDYSALPTNSPANQWTRQCPNLRTCFPNLTTSLNPFVDDRDLALRRSSLVAILLLRLIHFILVWRQWSVTKSPFEIFVFILDILFFFFVAWNLHLIVSMSGERTVFGVRWGRRSFDAFLWGMLALHVWAVGWRVIVGRTYLDYSTWALFSLLILGVAWVATWEGDVSLA